MTFADHVSAEERTTQQAGIDRRRVALTRARRNAVLAVLFLLASFALWTWFVFVEESAVAVVSIPVAAALILVTVTYRRLFFAEAEHDSYITHLTNAGILESA